MSEVYHIRLNEATRSKLDRLINRTNQSTADVIRQAIALMDLCLIEQSRGNRLTLLNSQGDAIGFPAIF